MTLADPIGDMITRIRNAQLRTLHNVKVPFDEVVNSALLIVNFKSSFWSAVQVEPFCDLNKTPAYGCLDIVLLEPILVSPNLPT